MYSEPRTVLVTAKVSEAMVRWKHATGYSWGDLIEAGIKASSGPIHKIEKEVALMDIERAARLTVERIEKYKKRRVVQHAMESRTKNARNNEGPLRKRVH